MKILLVEDEADLRASLSERLRREGYAVEEASDGQEGLYFATEVPIDLAIIDLGLPKLNGIDLIRRLRAQQQNCPILILTSRSHWQDKVEGLDAGADDFLVKPFSIEELLARIKALLRRARGISTPLLKSAELTLDLNAQQLLISGEEVELTAYEYKVLEYLMLHADQVISKTVLTDHLYEQAFDRDSNVIEVFIGRLRKKLDAAGVHQAIETHRGQGYRFALDLEGV
jgi:two-component system response regulator PhoP